MQKPLAACLVLALAACGGSTHAKTEAKTEPERQPTRVPIAPQDDDDDDSGPGDVQASGMLGTLQTADIQPVIEKSWNDVETCFTDHAARLRYVGGHVELKFRVARDGTVKHVHVAVGDLGAWPVEKCVLELAQAMTFPRPKGGEAVFSFPIDFPARSRTVSMEAGRAASDIGPRLKKLGKCNQASDGDAVPPLDITLYVGPGGKVLSVGFASNGDEPIPFGWADCVHDEITTWKLTDPRGAVAKTTAHFE
jgi:hypothetical protein